MQCNELPDTHINTCTNTLPNWVVQSVDGAGGPTLSCSHCSQSGVEPVVRIAASHINFSFSSLYLFSACLQQSAGGYNVGKTSWWEVLSCDPWYAALAAAMGTVRKPGSGWDTGGKLFLLSAMTHKRKYHFKHLICSNSQPELELSMRLHEILIFLEPS